MNSIFVFSEGPSVKDAFWVSLRHGGLLPVAGILPISKHEFAPMVSNWARSLANQIGIDRYMLTQNGS